MSGYILDYYREMELFRQGFNPTPQADEELMQHIDEVEDRNRFTSRRWQAKNRAKPSSRVLCPRCFQHMEIARSYNRTSKLYDCVHCGATLSKWEIFGTMAKDV